MLKGKKCKEQLFRIALMTSLIFVNPILAKADDSTTAEALADSMGLNSMWENWKVTWENTKTDWTQISLTPGSDESQLNFAWYSKKTDQLVENPKLVIGKGRNMKNPQVYEATQIPATTDKNGDEYFSNKVTAMNLQPNTTYYYSYQKENGNYSAPEEYKTKNTEAFRFIYVGDPQIGSSNPLKGQTSEAFYPAQSEAVESDSFNWNTTLNAAMTKTNEQASFVLSVGDQIQTTMEKSPDNDASTSEIEYAGYLSLDILKTLPVATTVGNHDADNPNYTYHFNTPNNSELGSNGIVGGDYSFTYGSALFLVLNTQNTDSAEHEEFLRETIRSNPECTWRIVSMHQDIYGAADHSDDSELVELRDTLTPIFDENKIDVVLTGHDHAYSRSKMVGSSDKQPESVNDGEFVVNPDGVLYLTAGSASGSKYYDLLPENQDYITSSWQEYTPTYSVVDMTENTFTISTYRTDTDRKIDKSFTIKKK